MAGTVAGHAFAHPGLALGVEPAIQAGGRRRVADEGRSISGRWLAGTILTALAGAGLIGTAIYTALDRQATFAVPPELAVGSRRSADNGGTDLRKGDRILKTVDVLAERQSFQAPTTVNVGDKQVIRLRGYTHVATTLTLTPTDLADAVPAFDPMKLLAADQPDAPDPTPDAGPVLDDAEVAFVTRDLAGADAMPFAGELSAEEAAAQVAQQVRPASGPNQPIVFLPPQLLLMRTVRAGSLAANLLGYADPGASGAAPFSSIEVRMVPENVSVIQRQESPRDGSPTEERLVVMHHGDTLDSALRANGASGQRLRDIVAAFSVKGGPPAVEGRRLRLQMASLDDPRAGPQIARVSIYLDETLEAAVALTDAGRYVRVEAVAPSRKVPVRAPDDDDAGAMRLYDSVYQTALKQQLPKPVIDTMIRIFSNDVDFQQAVQGGDSLDAFFANSDDGDNRQDLLFASLTVRDETFRYYRFQMPDDPGPSFFDGDGRSVEKFLIRKPVPNGLFTSPFGMRFHPVLGYSRPHTGVDWSAPVGSPILSAGNGTVLKAERSPSYGNHIEIQHPNGYITTYSHMVGFARGMADGIHVRQGQVIGYLGQTGLATGPHLHYEVIVNGHFVDPMRVRLARTREVSGKVMADFKREHDRIDALIASAPNAVQGAQNHAAN